MWNLIVMYPLNIVTQRYQTNTFKKYFKGGYFFLYGKKMCYFNINKNTVYLELTVLGEHLAMIL